MSKFLAILKKEIIQLIRDLPGLAILFLMPALMLVFITLSQEKVLTGRESGMQIIIVNADSSILGNQIESEIKASVLFRQKTGSSEKEAEEEVFCGKSQVMVYIPDSATEKLLASARHFRVDTAGDMEEQAGIRLLYDPAVMKIYKDMMISSLQMLIESVAMSVYMEAYSETIRSDLAAQWEAHKKKILSVDFADEMPDFPHKSQIIQHFQSSLEKRIGEVMPYSFSPHREEVKSPVRIEEKAAGSKNFNLQPDLVQNNVPAFILFAMFFIVLPLAGSVINEKQQGTKDRLMTLPVSGFLFLSGKITIYLLVCFFQFLVMIAIGMAGLPLISQLPPLSLDVNQWALMTTVIASALAAIGFGIVIGTLSNTYGQAAPFGSVLVVILAVLGGIFVPAFMMPEAMQKISIISPLRWGTDAFFSIFARGAGVADIWPQLLALLIFFGLTMFISVKINNRRR
jgi:ABC-2 type transport system permease protein